MFSVVFALPGGSADIAKLIFAPAGHMVASLVLLYNKAAFLALSVVQIILKKENFLSIALPLMHG
jgi:hypothetical protein